MRILLHTLLLSFLSAASVIAQDASNKPDGSADGGAISQSVPLEVDLYFSTLDASCASCHRSVSGLSIGLGGELSIGLAQGEFGLEAGYGTGAPMSSKVFASFASPDETTRTLLELPEDVNLVVGSLCPHHKSQQFGLELSDIILAVNDAPVPSKEKLDEALENSKDVVIRVRRQGKEVLLERPKAAMKTVDRRYLLGIRLGELEPVVRTQLGLPEHASVVITEVQEDSAASGADIIKNDIVLSVNGNNVENAETLQSVVNESKGSLVTLVVYRKGKQVEVSVKPRLVETPVTVYQAPRKYKNLEAPVTAYDPVAPTQYLWSLPGTSKARGASDSALQVAEKLQSQLKEIHNELDEIKSMIRQLKAADDKIE